MRHTRDVMDEQPRLLHCLAPNWVCLARPGCPKRRWALTPPFHPCGLRRGLFSVALSIRTSLQMPSRPFERSSALRCSDFPLADKRRANARLPIFLSFTCMGGFSFQEKSPCNFCCFHFKNAACEFSNPLLCFFSS